MINDEADTISKASAYGDFDRLKRFVAADPACINEPDESGYYPLQWAALNNRINEANYLISQGALINAVDQTGQTALHWAAVRGSLRVVETLLSHNADYELKDSRGYSATHVAAQYGQSAVLHLLALKWNVDVDMPDNDGRTPLHWAAYKGFPDTTRLLLVLDARYDLADKEGCTPLHWAAIKGNAEACTALLQGGAESTLMFKDVTGLTPAQLALEKGHRYLARYLTDYSKNCDGEGHGGATTSWLSGVHLSILVWLYATGVSTLFIHKVMRGPRAAMGRSLTLWSWSVIVAVAIGLFFLYKTTIADPGFIPRGGEARSKRGRARADDGDSESARNPLLTGRHKALDSPALWAGSWHQLCVSCRIVRPLRAKHCSVTDRCIEVYDHYCPWVGNAIGKGNRHFFLLFLWFELYAMVVSAIVGVFRIRSCLASEHADTATLAWLIGFEVVDVAFGIGVAALALTQSWQIARNVTTNELSNWHRYKYLHAPGGGFQNPFNRGCRANCMEACFPASVPTAPVYLPKLERGESQA